jgi:amino acid transporter
MNIVWAVIAVAAATAVSVAAMLVVRSRAPEGGYFADGDRAAGVFGVLATGFSVLLGFIVFLAFTSYDSARAGAEDEARILTQQFETAQFMGAVGGRLGDELICYARSVAFEEWPQLEAGGSPETNRWGVPLYRTLRTARPSSPTEEAAYSKWLDQTSDRQDARQDRVHPAEGVIPSPLWFVLLLIAAVIFVFMLFFADRGERAKVQALLIGSVTVTIVAMLLVIRFLDDPFRGDVGSLRPVAMERALRTLDFEREAVGRTTPLPCTATGEPVP